MKLTTEFIEFLKKLGVNEEQLHVGKASIIGDEYDEITFGELIDNKIHPITVVIIDEENAQIIVKRDIEKADSEEKELELLRKVNSINLKYIGVTLSVEETGDKLRLTTLCNPKGDAETLLQHVIVQINLVTDELGEF